jgi:hypothetical protein
MTKERWGFAGAVDEITRLEELVKKVIASNEAATIERCAQVAESFFNHPQPDLHRKIAAAIRALKDKP